MFVIVTSLIFHKKKLNESQTAGNRLIERKLRLKL